MKKVMLFAVFLLASVGIYGLISVNVARASVNLAPDPSCCVPDHYLDYLKGADQGPNAARLTIWVSDQTPPPTDYKNQVLNADVGDTSLPMSFSYAGAVGRNDNRAKISRAKITKAPYTTGLVSNDLMTINWGNSYNQPGAYDHAGRAFNFTQEIQVSRTYSVVVTIRQVIEYDNGTFECVTPVGQTPFAVSGVDKIDLCPEASTTLSFYVSAPNRQFDHRAQVKLCDSGGSPAGGVVEPGIEYTLCPLVRNRGPETSGEHPQLLGVVNQHKNKVEAVIGGGGIGQLVPTANQDTIYGAKKGFATSNKVCDPEEVDNRDCWFWGFQALGPDQQADSTFRFKLTSQAQSGDQVCFLPFVKKRSNNNPVFVGDQLCFTVSDVNCPAGSTYAGQLIANQPDRNGDGQINVLDCNDPPIYKYLRIYGSDVMAGGGFGQPCTMYNANAKVESYAYSTPVGPSNEWKGASSQFGTFALGLIEGFYSANLRGPTGTTGLPRPPVGLSFGNTNNGINEVQQNSAGLSGVESCIPDFYARGEANGLVQAGGPLNSNSISPIAQGSHQALYYNGNVFITGSGITFANSGSSWGATVSNIPSFFLVVRGNIYIDRTVSQLDGVYVAQPDPANPNTTGIINTCTNAVGTDLALGNCDTKLTINGAFAAQKVKFKRTGGDLKAATSNEVPSSGNIAEVFNFSPEIYLSTLHPSLLRSVPYSKYDYITSLPPIL